MARSPARGAGFDAAPPIVTLRHGSRLHHIGRAHAGKRVTLLITELHIRIITDLGGGPRAGKRS